ncbi:MAG: YgiQ family radical SAM protein [Candidatus Zixiibacteriota bacterium]|nr:MAG: YgiQ family radical SAM protein [candidate division Zixibacteria bacterium]
MKFLPTTKRELKLLGWSKLDIILVTGDTYIDSSYIGVSVIGRVLVEVGYRVGIIAQPDVGSGKDIGRLGEPELFWGVTGGSVDSMVANYTATKRKRKSDDFTPGCKNTLRPDRAVIAYSNLIRRHFKQTKPIVLGGVEASLRRIAHYDFWSDSIRKSILFDAKADYLVYGMGEKAIVGIAHALSKDCDATDIRGICYISREKRQDYIELPPYQEVVASQLAFVEMFKLFSENADSVSAAGLSQKQDTRYLIVNPPSVALSMEELDAIHELTYTNDVHPFYKRQGKVKALDTIRFSVATHRGCYGQCNFCSITVHQGRTVQSRSEDSIIREVKRLTSFPDFKGQIRDVGGPTANMYGSKCDKQLAEGSCKHKRCLYPRKCKDMKVAHDRQTQLLTELRKLPGIKKVSVASGIRYDVVLADRQHGLAYMKEVVNHHVSGQMKIAPEHTVDRVLKKMGKPWQSSLTDFCDLFADLTRKARKQQFLTYYLMAAHPGCTLRDMQALKDFTSDRLKVRPEQVQIFTPLPSTWSALMYYTERGSVSGERLFVEKDPSGKEEQKRAIVSKPRTRHGRP